MDYKDSINLPKTAFKMKASLPQKEPQRLKTWEESGLYEKIKASRKDASPFILHDGPPYANGNIHIGHALNKILKDIIIKCKTMEGFGTLYVPGWDCHGLPIEINVEKQLGKKKSTLSKVEIRQNCREYARKKPGSQLDLGPISCPGFSGASCAPPIALGQQLAPRQSVKRITPWRAPEWYARRPT